MFVALMYAGSVNSPE